MAKTSNQKAKILYLMRLFQEETDEEHPLSRRALEERLADIGIHAERKSLYNDIETLKTFGRRWHLGAGGNLQVNYRIGRRFIVGIYTNAVCLTGKKMDEMPHLSDRANIVWDTGLNLGWFFGKGKHK